jgi:hypothetical protein
VDFSAGFDHLDLDRLTSVKDRSVSAISLLLSAGPLGAGSVASTVSIGKTVSVGFTDSTRDSISLFCSPERTVQAFIVCVDIVLTKISLVVDDNRSNSELKKSTFWCYVEGTEGTRGQ